MAVFISEVTLKITMNKELKFCEDAIKDFNLTVSCCTSCHSEWDDTSYEPCEIETETCRYMVCCTVVDAYKQKYNGKND